MTCREPGTSSTIAGSAIACRLEGDDYRRRLASIGELAHAALLDHRRDNRSLCLAYAPEAAAPVIRMVEEERVCCPFLVIELEETAAAVFVRIVPPRLDPAMLEMLFGPLYRRGSGPDLYRVARARGQTGHRGAARSSYIGRMISCNHTT